MMKMKSKSIFTSPEVLQYTANAIYENLYKNDNPVNYTYWSLAFHNTYSELMLENKEAKKIKNYEGDVANFTINSTNERGVPFFRNLFAIVFDLEENKMIEDSDIFIGNMLAWMLDPARSYFTSKQRERAIEEVNFILNRNHRILRYSNNKKKYVFEKQLEVTPIDSETIFIYNERIFITKGLLNHRKDNDIVETIKTKPSEIKILTFLIGIGRANPNNWLKTKDIATRMDLEIGTVSNSISAIRKISKIIGVDLIEDRGLDAKGKEFRLNPKVL